MTKPPTANKHFLYKLIPLRPGFDTDMSASEASAMKEHVRYWSELAAEGTVVVFGPVSDPAGVWGVAIVAAAREKDVHALGLSDPAVRAGVAAFEVFTMPIAVIGAVGAATSSRGARGDQGLP